MRKITRPSMLSAVEEAKGMTEKEAKTFFENPPKGIEATTYWKAICLKEYKEKGHPGYRVDSGYYNPVLYNLLKLQGNLCAYTERRIYYGEPAWVNGEPEFAADSHALEKKRDADASIEHFDPSIKKERGWLWDNLFAVHGIINSKKNSKKFPDYLKPDHPDYAPEKYLDYDATYHIFIAHPTLDDTEAQEVEEAIEGVLNFGMVQGQRSEYFNQQHVFALGNEEDSEPSQFPTAWSMLKAQNQ